jgi:hypothetical protein
LRRQFFMRRKGEAMAVEEQTPGRGVRNVYW